MPKYSADNASLAVTPSAASTTAAIQLHADLLALVSIRNLLDDFCSKNNPQSTARHSHGPLQLPAIDSRLISGPSGPSLESGARSGPLVVAQPMPFARGEVMSRQMADFSQNDIPNNDSDARDTYPSPPRAFGGVSRKVHPVEVEPSNAASDGRRTSKVLSGGSSEGRRDSAANWKSFKPAASKNDSTKAEFEMF